MRNETRIKFNGYSAQVAKLNGVDSAAVKFSVTPSVQQRLEAKIQETTAFLKKVNIIGVTEQEGEALSLGSKGPGAGRTNTANGHRRNPASRGALTKDAYKCVKTDFDTAFNYSEIDQWAGHPEFQTLLTAAITEQQGLDRIMIGFNGTSAATETDLQANPLLQDVNIGWLQKIRISASTRVMDEGVVGSGKVTIGPNGDYVSLDSLVYDAVQALDPWHRNRPDLVVVVSRDLMHSKLLKAIDNGAKGNQEENAAGEIIARARLGGLPVEDAPFFPDGTVLITTLSNLSIYYQTGSRRRHLKEEPEFDRIADYQSSNDAYVIEDLGLVALVENIQEAA
ncbi:phage major capsid protein, P2 family [Pseudomonas sp. 21LCFQ010]|uniref:phage major capsid protein, P2 family n=1 Tax=Pseudomonas sp. 21LCFQ010 TaxID=2957506 RepID=UPI002097238A|nr:phage major capsid protein, P2 family [Pseudomonas sp. 21LCFQ010]MCO8162001.1 phage major capsid protein, P2 family [Pseudomonas sp. 21LCFQ010]